jgi:hypothetical protein
MTCAQTLAALTERYERLRHSTPCRLLAIKVTRAEVEAACLASGQDPAEINWARVRMFQLPARVVDPPSVPLMTPETLQRLRLLDGQPWVDA